MKHMQTPSHTFIAVRLETTGRVLRKPFEVVKKFNIVVTPSYCCCCELSVEKLDLSKTEKLALAICNLFTIMLHTYMEHDGGLIFGVLGCSSRMVYFVWLLQFS